MQRLVEAIFWFHPLVWWASRQAAAAREIRCDRDSVSSRQEVAAYLRSLLRLIELRLNEPALLPAGVGFLGDSSLLGRRANLLVESFEKPNAPSVRWRPVFALGLALAFCILVWLPVNPRASRRADWSPWPRWSAQTLDAVGLPVRDYEIDGHRLDGHEH
jgi:beta-lactamase regulating signal transducer with metallopeptidase domain